jgi:hypothetical protein
VQVLRGPCLQPEHTTHWLQHSGGLGCLHTLATSACSPLNTHKEGPQRHHPKPRDNDITQTSVTLTRSVMRLKTCDDDATLS